VAQVRRAGVQQPLRPVLHHDHLLLRPVGAPGGPLGRFDHEREHGGGAPGQHGQRRPGGGTREARKAAAAGELGEDQERRGGVPPDRDPPPRAVRRQRGGQCGEAGEQQRDRVQAEVDGQTAAGLVGGRQPGSAAGLYRCGSIEHGSA
jgi:hypothetical protein